MKILHSLFWALLVLTTAQAALAFCGNGKLDDGEECDFVTGSAPAAYTRHATCWHVDRDYTSGRLECTSNCRYERDNDGKLVGCTEGSGPRCGDGFYQVGETWCEPALQCNCSDNCYRTRGQCGDACLDGNEECDNGTQNSDSRPDACRTDCRLPRCGDDVVDTGEQCDDGSRNSNFVPDACRTDCRLPRCGDGIIDVGRGEQCDLGAANSDAIGSPCTTSCIVPYCGNGIVDAGEICDEASTSNTGWCTRSCRPNVCGDGFVYTNVEVCDGGNCDYACFRDPTLCGNGVLEAGEECDEGNANAETPGAPCRTDCMLPRCGDGVVDAGEECDRTPGCLSDCTFLP